MVPNQDGSDGDVGGNLVSHHPSGDQDVLSGHLDSVSALAFEATSDGFWVWHIPSEEAYFSPRYYQILGYEPGELQASLKTWVGLVHPDDLAETQQHIQAHIESRDDTFEAEYRLRTKTGQWLWILGRGKVVERDADGKPVQVLGNHVNIDSRKRAEAQLIEYRRRLKSVVEKQNCQLDQAPSLMEAIFNAIPDVIGVQDDQHRIIRYNTAGYRFLNKTHAEVVGRPCYELIGRDQPCGQCATSECYRTKKPASVERYEESLGIWLDVRAYPILDEAGGVVKVIEHLQDITAAKQAETENKRLHEQLQHSQKMEAIGTLAGGIAHDFNNILSAILGYAELGLSDISEETNIKKKLEAIYASGLRARDLVSHILSFSRKDERIRTPVELRFLIEDALKMLRPAISKNIAIQTRLVPACHVMGDPTRLHQVIMNLCTNAYQAMRETGGTLTISLSQVKIDGDLAKRTRLNRGMYAKLIVSDTGEGIAPENLKRIFDPYFTTKEKGHGTGLGLAAVHGIVQSHAGGIFVKSRPEIGTTFAVFMPLCPEPAAEQEAAPAEPVVGKERILIVDDEPAILEIQTEILKQLGYTITAKNEAIKALETFVNQPDEFDLVITDMAMPSLNGDQLARRMIEIRPDIPIILCTGFSELVSPEKAESIGIKGFLMKPISMKDLSEMIRKVLKDKKEKDEIQTV